MGQQKSQSLVLNRTGFREAGRTPTQIFLEYSPSGGHSSSLPCFCIPPSLPSQALNFYLPDPQSQCGSRFAAILFFFFHDCHITVSIHTFTLVSGFTLIKPYGIVVVIY